MAGRHHRHTHTLATFPHQGPTLNCGIHVIQNYAYVLQAWMNNPDTEAFIDFLHSQHIMLVPMSVLRPRVIEFLRNPPPRRPRRPHSQQAEISVDPPPQRQLLTHQLTPPATIPAITWRTQPKDYVKISPMQRIYRPYYQAHVTNDRDLA